MEGFLLQATIYLLAMVVAVPLSARLGLGSVLGYLVAGILIGPVLHLAASSEMQGLQHFAEFGVVMMLFLIGLELEPRVLWAMRRKLLGLGGAQILITVAILASIVLAAGESLSVALTLGMILSLSSTAIVLQSLNEKKLMQTVGGRNAFSVLLTQDIAVIPMLALMPILAGGHAIVTGDAGHGGGGFITSLPGWGAALVTLAAVGGVVLAGQYLFRPLFRLVQSVRLDEMNTAVSLLFVVGIAWLMTFVNLSPALGTFLAGVMLAGSEFRHELEAQVAPFKGLLLGLFFITVGAGMNFAMLAEQPFVILGATAILIAVKAGVLHAVARMVRMPVRERALFTLSLAQAGEFGFVLVSYAVSLALLPYHLAQGFLLVIALSMLATPLLFILYDKIARKLADDRALPAADHIDEQQPIIIAGVGRFGQVVNRLVTLSGFKTTVLDHDLSVIQLMRRFGFKGYFGDPTKPEILAAAGIDKARILVAAMDDPAANLRLVRYARQRRSDLRIIARAHDRVHVYELYEAGADHIVREMFDSSLRVGRYVLENAGLSEYEAAELEKVFYRMDRQGLRRLAEVWKPGVPAENNPAYVERSRELNTAMENALMERFAHGPAASPLLAHDNEDAEPEHGLVAPARRPGRSASAGKWALRDE